MRIKEKSRVKEKFKNLYYRLKMNFHNISVMKVLFICFVVILTYNCLDMVAHASGMLDYGSGTSPFEGVKTGLGQFMSEQYRNNYFLDPGDTSFFDISKILNAVANLFFSMVVLISWLTLNIFNLCFSSNIPDQFAGILDKVSTAFSKGVFTKFFIIMFMISTIMFVINYAKRNFAAIFGQLMATVIIITSVAIITSTGARSFVIETTDLARSIGASMITSINNVDKNDKNDGFAEDGSVTSEMLGTMWANLVHKPWIILEFNGAKSIDSEEAVTLSQEILSKNQDDNEREDIAKDHIKDVSFAARAGTTIVLGVITIIKCFVIMVLGVIQVFFQILAIGIVLIAPLMFLLAVVPFFGGLNLIRWLGEKYLGVQFSIVLLSFGIAMLILVDNILLTFFIGVGASFVVAMLIQCLCWVLAIVFRKNIMEALKSIQEKVSTGSGSNLKLGDKLFDKGAKAGRDAVEPIRRKAVDFKDLAGANARYAKAYLKGKAKLYKAKKLADIIDKANNKFSKSSNNKSENSKKENKYKKGANINFDELKKKREEAEANSKSVNFDAKDRMDAERNKEQDAVKFEEENKRADDKNNIDKKNEMDDKNRVNDHNEEKMKNERENETVKDGEDLSAENLKNEKEKVVSLNDKRVEKGFAPVDDEKIKDDIRENLNKEKIKDKKDKIKADGKSEAEKLVKKKRKQSKARAEKLKKALGVNKSQIRSKEIKLKKELRSIKREKINIKNREK